MSNLVPESLLWPHLPSLPKVPLDEDPTPHSPTETCPFPPFPHRPHHLWSQTADSWGKGLLHGLERGTAKGMKAHQRCQQLGHGKVAIRLWVSWLVTGRGGGGRAPALPTTPSSAQLPSLAPSPLPSTFTPDSPLDPHHMRQYVYCHFHGTGGAKAQEAKGPARAHTTWR